MNTLYHGTRAYFREAIERDGLGAQKLSTQYRIPEFLRAGLTLLCKQADGVWDWQSSDPAKHPTHLIESFSFIRSCALQSNQSAFNFSHHHPWLAVHRNDAESYAREVPEVLRFSFILVDLLETRGLTATIDERTFCDFWTQARRDDLQSSHSIVLRVNMQDLPMSNWFLDSGKALTAWPNPVPRAWERNRLVYEYRGVIPGEAITFEACERA